MSIREKLLAQTLAEAETGIRMMFRDLTSQHCFNFGTDVRNGEKLLFVMTIVPEDQYNRALTAAGKHTHDSRPLDVEKAQPDQAQKQSEAKTTCQ